MSQRRSRIPELDGFRVLLVFIVSWYHIWQQSWWTPRIGNVSLDFLVRSGYMPVDGTILLSGFLLFLPYARHMLNGEPYPSWKDFYRRRIARIVPAYYAFLLLMLLAVALPWNLYPSQSFLLRDILSHLTFTFTFRVDTYMSTPLGVACWTLAIEMQAYLLFPLIARWAVKKPSVTFPVMILLSWGWRYACIQLLSDYAMVVNQLPSFIDVYALGMMAALVYVKLSKISLKGWKSLLFQLVATIVLALCLWGTYLLVKTQASSANYAAIQSGQMIRRFPYALLLAGIMLALPFTLRPIRFLMGNRVMGFLAGISMNYYLLHQVVAVHLKRLGIPASVAENPNQAGEMPWQMEYTYLTFGLSVLLAILLTYLVEKPCAKLILGKKRKAPNPEKA
jgi:peptidoglycan/LPS O-acetylase OafA/YrhL